MSSAIADRVPPRPLGAATECRVAVVAVGASSRETVAALLATTVRTWAGRIVERSVSELASEPADAVMLVTDLRAPAGMAALRRIRSELPAARLVVIAPADHTATAARQALNAGADAFVPADEVDLALRPALDAVMAGLVCAPRAARRLIAKPTFSHREKEILELLLEGLTNRQIGARLYLAESTVKSHLISAFAKLGVRSRKDAVALLLDPAEGLAITALPHIAGAATRKSGAHVPVDPAGATSERDD
jgi:DNA-binding NarL/FixJ family response regulator